MSFPLRMRQVIPLRVVQGQAQFTFVTPEVVLHKVRIFIEINSLQGELPQSFPPIKIGLLGGLQPTAAMFRVDAVLVEHLGGRWLCAVFERCVGALAGVLRALVRASVRWRRRRARRCDWLAGLFSWLSSGASRRLRIGRAACQEMCRAYQSCSLSIYRRAACKGRFLASVVYAY